MEIQKVANYVGALVVTPLTLMAIAGIGSSSKNTAEEIFDRHLAPVEERLEGVVNGCNLLGISPGDCVQYQALESDVERICVGVSRGYGLKSSACSIGEEDGGYVISRKGISTPGTYDALERAGFVGAFTRF